MSHYSDLARGGGRSKALYIQSDKTSLTCRKLGVGPSVLFESFDVTFRTGINAAALWEGVRFGLRAREPRDSVPRSKLLKIDH